MNKPFIKIGKNKWVNLENVTDIRYEPASLGSPALRFYIPDSGGNEERAYIEAGRDYTAQVAEFLGLELDEIPESAPVEPVTDEDIPW